MKLRQFLHNSEVREQRGTTIVELMVTALLGLGVSALCLKMTTTSHKFLARDMLRTKVNQNLRGSMEIINMDLRIAGENLNENFPAILLETNDEGNDVLVVRRNIISDSITLCDTFALGENTSDYIEIANGSLISGCDYSSKKDMFEAWQNYLANETGGTLRAFVYSISAKEGEFVNISSMTDTTSELRFNLEESVTWKRDYPGSSSAMYVIEEWRYTLSDDELHIIENEDYENPKKISFGLSEMDIKILLRDGTTKETFDKEEKWTEIQHISLALSSEEISGKNSYSRTIVGKFFPRNILSY